MPPILSPPPGHPGAVTVGGRGGRVGFKAELLRGFGDAVDEEVLVLIVVVPAYDRYKNRPDRNTESPRR